MMPFRLAALALLIALPAAGQAPGPGCADHQAAFPALIGGAPEAVQAALAAMPGIRTIRMGGSNTPMTRDFRLDRATLLLDAGLVRGISCG